MFKNNYEKKTEEIRVRCTKKEKEKIQGLLKNTGITVSDFIRQSISTNLRIHEVINGLNNKSKTNYEEIIQLLEEELQNGISDPLEKTLKKIDDINFKITYYNNKLWEVPASELKPEDDTDEISLNDSINYNV